MQRSHDRCSNLAVNVGDFVDTVQLWPQSRFISVSSYVTLSGQSTDGNEFKMSGLKDPVDVDDSSNTI